MFSCAQTIIYRIDNQQSPWQSTVEHMQLCSYPVINHNKKEYEKAYICITELLSCTAEIKHNIVNQLCFNKNLKEDSTDKCISNMIIHSIHSKSKVFKWFNKNSLKKSSKYSTWRTNTLIYFWNELKHSFSILVFFWRLLTVFLLNSVMTLCFSLSETTEFSNLHCSSHM